MRNNMQDNELIGEIPCHAVENTLHDMKIPTIPKLPKGEIMTKEAAKHMVIIV